MLTYRLLVIRWSCNVYIIDAQTTTIRDRSPGLCWCQQCESRCRLLRCLMLTLTRLMSVISFCGFVDLWCFIIGPEKRRNSHCLAGRSQHSAQHRYLMTQSPLGESQSLTGKRLYQAAINRPGGEEPRPAPAVSRLRWRHGLQPGGTGDAGSAGRQFTNRTILLYKTDKFDLL